MAPGHTIVFSRAAYVIEAIPTELFMSPQDRQAIDSVFTRIEEVGRQGAPRDFEAERMIQERIQQNPESAYYLAQTVLIQQEALKNAQQQLQKQSQAPAAAAAPAPAAARAPAAPVSSLSSSGFGRQAAPEQPAAASSLSSGFGRNNNGGGGGGFLAGAMQTALGVAGGMMLGNMLGGLFGGNDAQAAEAPAEEDVAAAAPEEDYGSADDAGYDDGGGFDEE